VLIRIILIVLLQEVSTRRDQVSGSSIAPSDATLLELPVIGENGGMRSKKLISSNKLKSYFYILL
jgi:hypothetical protein